MAPGWARAQAAAHGLGLHFLFDFNHNPLQIPQLPRLPAGGRTSGQQHSKTENTSAKLCGEMKESQAQT